MTDFWVFRFEERRTKDSSCLLPLSIDRRSRSASPSPPGWPEEEREFLTLLVGSLTHNPLSIHQPAPSCGRRLPLQRAAPRVPSRMSRLWRNVAARLFQHGDGDQAVQESPEGGQETSEEEATRHPSGEEFGTVSMLIGRRRPTMRGGDVVASTGGFESSEEDGSTARLSRRSSVLVGFYSLVRELRAFCPPFASALLNGT
uniref:Uncharacterized protein n=1 Tax=Steinernema glaseri TaxID=37863 RepID=A0A1I7Y4F8_9BILA